MNTRTIRVLVIDDSALARKIIISSLAPFPDIKIIGTAVDPYAARDQILEHNPDVITLDIEMPRMDGITFLKLIMKHRPMPVVIMSSLTTPGSHKALEALQAGAVEVMGKPTGAYSASLDGALLAEKIKAAAGARLLAGTPESAAQTVVPQTPLTATRRHFSSRDLILIGASTGGTEAIKAILLSSRADLPAICIVQHMPPLFSKTFADRLNQICPMAVREATNGEAAAPGLVLIAPGGSHMILKWRAGRYVVELNDGPPIHYQRPSVDILFASAVKAGAGPHTVAALLTGMGSDGAEGLLQLRQAGAATIAQNEETSVVFGMPRQAILLGAAEHILPLPAIAPHMDTLILRRSGVPADIAAGVHADAATATAVRATLHPHRL